MTNEIKNLNFKRVRAGFYRCETTTVLTKDGEDEEVNVVVHVIKRDWNGPDKWAVHMWREGNEHGTYGLVSDADCPCRTYKEGKEQAALIASKGFRYVRGLGYCGRP